MNRGFFRKILLLGGAMLLSLTLAAHPALAQGPLALEIISVFVDVGGGTILINGMNFNNGSFPVVTLGGQSLTVISPPSPVEIEVELPLGLSDGDHLLTVTTGAALHKIDFYDLTTGPPGLPGAEIVLEPFVTVVAGGDAEFFTNCPAGKIALASGLQGGGAFNVISESFPIEEGVWFTEIINTTQNPITIRPVVICITAP